MMPSRILKASLAAASLLLVTPHPGLAQTQGTEAHHAQSQSVPAAPSTPDAGAMPRPGVPGGGSMPMMNGSDPEVEMMDCPMMVEMMRMHPGMMTQMMRMHPEMMAMMHGREGGSADMMGQRPGSRMMMRPGGMGLDAGVVTPVQHLSVDDARHYFEHQLKQIGNDRLKVGKITEASDDAISVDIVTVDDSLVDRLDVDRHDGTIRRAK